MQIKTAALIGLGAIGSFIAPRLNEALGPGGFKVVAEGARKRRLLEEGTTINGTRYVFDVADPAEPASRWTLSLCWLSIMPCLRPYRISGPWWGRIR